MRQQRLARVKPRQGHDATVIVDDLEAVKAGAEIDDDGEVEPSVAGRDEGNVPGPGAVRYGRQRLAGEQIGRGLVGSAVAGFGDEGLRRNGVPASLGHEATDCRCFIWRKE